MTSISTIGKISSDDSSYRKNLDPSRDLKRTMSLNNILLHLPTTENIKKESKKSTELVKNSKNLRGSNKIDELIKNLKEHLKTNLKAEDVLIKFQDEIESTIKQAAEKEKQYQIDLANQHNKVLTMASQKLFLQLDFQEHLKMKKKMSSYEERQQVAEGFVNMQISGWNAKIKNALNDYENHLKEKLQARSEELYKID